MYYELADNAIICLYKLSFLRWGSCAYK